MKSITKKVFLLVFVALFLFASSSMFYRPLTDVDAGASKSYILSKVSVNGDAINLGDFMINGGVYGKSNRIRFDKDKVKDNSYIIATKKVNNLRFSGVPHLYSFNMTVNISDFAVQDNSSISFIFGMNGLRNVGNAKDCIKIIFDKNPTQNKTDLTVVEVFDDENKQDNVIFEKTCIQSLKFDKDFELIVDAESDGTTTISVDGKNIIKGYKTLIDQTGYFAVYSEGKNDFSLSKMEMISHNYITALNVDYIETFDNGEYNANIFYSSAIASDYNPASLSVNTESGALEFVNTSEAYFSTVMPYSNFELEFDLFDLVGADIKDDDGNIIKPMTDRIGIGLGENYKGTVPSFEHGDTWLLMWGGRKSGGIYKMLEMFEDRGEVTLMNKFNLWNEEFINGRKVNLRYTSLDGMVTLELKFDGDYPLQPTDEGYDENEAKLYTYQTYYSCDLGKSISGHVKIFSYGNANYKIDNLSIKNLDFESVRQSLSKEEVGFVTNKRDKTPDFEYTTKPDDNDLIMNNLNKELPSGSGCGASISVGGISLLLLATGAVIMAGRNKK